MSLNPKVYKLKESIALMVSTPESRVYLTNFQQVRSTWLLEFCIWHLKTVSKFDGFLQLSCEQWWWKVKFFLFWCVWSPHKENPQPVCFAVVSIELCSATLGLVISWLAFVTSALASCAYRNPIALFISCNKLQVDKLGTWTFQRNGIPNWSCEISLKFARV